MWRSPLSLVAVLAAVLAQASVVVAEATDAEFKGCMETFCSKKAFLMSCIKSADGTVAPYYSRCTVFCHQFDLFNEVACPAGMLVTCVETFCDDERRVEEDAVCKKGSMTERYSSVCHAGCQGLAEGETETCRTSTTTTTTTVVTTTTVTTTTATTVTTTHPFCGKGQFLDTDSPGKPARCTPCPAGSFMAADGHQNRQCVACQPACAFGGGTYEAQACTATQPRACLPCTRCGDGEFTQAVCSQTSDTLCHPATKCPNRCAVDASTQKCAAGPGTPAGARGSLHGGRSCFLLADPAVCNTERGCVYDTLAQGCRSSSKHFACEVYSAATCPGATALEFEAAPKGANGMYVVGQDTVCQPVTECTAGEYLRVPATATADGKCSALTRCRLGDQSEWECTPATASSDRKCCAVTGAIPRPGPDGGPSWSCPGGGFQVRAPTATSDRVCQQVTTCNSTEFASAQPTAVSDRECRAVSPRCDPAVQYEAAGPGSDADRDCQPLTECAWDTEYEEVGGPAYRTADRACTPRRVCTAAEFEVVNGTRTSDRVCAAITVCTPGQEYQTVAFDRDLAIDRVCAPLRECAAGSEYQTLAPTATSDRKCAFVASNCEVGEEYEHTAASATENRECRGLTQCNATSQFESVAATASTDRACAALAPLDCGNGEGPVTRFQAAAPTATSDRVCRNATACAEGRQYQAAAPTYFADRVCAPVTPCSAGSYETAAPTALEDRVCAPKSACSAGQFVVDDGSATADRTCGPCRTCGQGFYGSGGCDGVRDTACTRCSACVPIDVDAGVLVEYESKACSATSNTECSKIMPCSPGAEYMHAEATATTQRDCRNATVCAPSEWESAALMGSQDRACEPTTACAALAAQECGSRRQSGSGAAGPSNVNLGECYTSVPATRTSDSVCQATNGACSPGTYESKPATMSSDRECLACAAGTYQDELGKDFCKSVDECLAGSEYEVAAPTLASNRVCSSCAVCGVSKGEFQTAACTTRSDRKCSICADGRYRDTDLQACGECKTCSSDEYETAPCTKTQPRTCAFCAWGMYLSNRSATTAAGACTAQPTCKSGEFEAAPARDTAPRVCREHTRCTSTEYEVRAGTRLSDRVCANTTTCTVGEFQQVAPTPASDRRCAECDGYTQYQDEAGQPMCKDAAPVCSGATGRYELSAPTPSSDRVCGDLTKCAVGVEYASVPPSEFTDRKCSMCGARCKRGEYEAVGCTADTNRECAALTECQSREFEATPATGTSDRECRPLAVCPPTHFASVQATPRSNRVCTQLSICEPGTYVLAVPTATSDRVCAPCTAGVSFATTINEQRCARCRDPRSCGPGQFATPCAEVQDAFCVLCGAGMFKVPGNNSCLPWTRCSDGTQEVAPPNAAMDRVCQVCPLGTYRAGDMLQCFPHTVCGAGESPRTDEPFTPNARRDRVCVLQPATIPPPPLPAPTPWVRPGAEFESGRETTAAAAEEENTEAAFDFEDPLVVAVLSGIAAVFICTCVWMCLCMDKPEEKRLGPLPQHHANAREAHYSKGYSVPAKGGATHFVPGAMSLNAYEETHL